MTTRSFANDLGRTTLRLTDVEAVEVMDLLALDYKKDGLEIWEIPFKDLSEMQVIVLELRMRIFADRVLVCSMMEESLT